VNPQAIEQIPGQLNNRKTIMGELNWIFTAITDTIAWNILSSLVSLLSSLFSRPISSNASSAFCVSIRTFVPVKQVNDLASRAGIFSRPISFSASSVKVRKFTCFAGTRVQILTPENTNDLL
jgi:hypothetical protein